MTDWWSIDEIDASGLPFAFDREGQMRDVDEVARGIACACFCPECRGPVIARQGDVRIHHFAHADRRECRYALEASLYGMALQLLAEAGASLMLPSVGNRDELLGQAGIQATAVELRGVFPLPAIVGPRRISLAGAVVQAGVVSGAAAERPELKVPNEGLDVHLLSNFKSLRQISQTAGGEQTAVLAINLQDFARRWWRVCEPNRDPEVNALGAREAMRAWLEIEISGRGWSFHPAIPPRKAELAAWATERQAAMLATENELRASFAVRLISPDMMWTAPVAQAHPAGGSAGDAAEFMLPVKAGNGWITHYHAQQFGLRWHPGRKSWAFVAVAGTVVPATARRILEAARGWEPVLRSDCLLPCDQAPDNFPGGRATDGDLSRQSEANQIVKAGVDQCWCGATRNEIRLSSGPYIGRTALQCSKTPRHPLKMVD